MDNERVLLVNALSKTCARELTDQLQHYKDVFEIDAQLEIIDSDVVTKKFYKIINDHLTTRNRLLEKDVLWYEKVR